MNKKLQKVHEKARLAFDRIQAALSDEREQCLEDRRFYSISGAMWEGRLKEQYANKPRFEINKIHLSIIKIINEYRNNRITVKFLPKSGEKNQELSDTLNGLFRADEQDCIADEAYDNAFEEGVGGGIGAWRITTKYEDEYDDDNDKQRIVIDPIFDADTSVFFDLNAKRYDKSDAKYCFVIHSYNRPDYIDEFDDDPETWPKTVEQNEFDWETVDVVYVAEYYEIEEKTEAIQIWETLDEKEIEYTQKDFEEDPDLERILAAKGTRLIKEKDIKKKKVHKYILSGGKILEDCGYIAGTEIPIVPFYGKRWFVDNVERCMGHVRLCKDISRIKNMQISKMVEIASLSSVEKPILDPEQIAGHQQWWLNDNIENYPYLPLNALTDVNGNKIPSGPLDYTRVPQIPPAMAGLMQLVDIDQKDILGNTQSNEEIRSNISGEAIQKINDRLDMQTFIYISNFAKSIQRSGVIWLNMAKDVYVEQNREMKILGDRDEQDFVILHQPTTDPETDEIIYENDISRCYMGVSVSVGPSSDSKRSSTVSKLTEMIGYAQGDQEAQSVLISLAMLNLDGEGIDDARDFFRRRMVQIGAVKPTQDELEQMKKQEEENKQPDPNEILILSAAEEAQAKAEKAKADVIKTGAEIENIQADTEKKQAEILETLSDISKEEQQTASDALNVLGAESKPPGV